MDDTTSTIAAIQSIMAPPPPDTLPPGARSALPFTLIGRVEPNGLTSLCGPVKNAKIKMLKLLKNQPQPDLRAIAGRLGITERAAKMHLQILFRAGLITKRARYELTPAGKAWLAYEARSAARALIMHTRASLYKSPRGMTAQPRVCPLCQQPIVREAA